MKYLITERQLKLIKEQDEILELDFDFFNNNWNILQKFLERRGNPPYIITGDLDLRNTKIESLGNLQSVDGDLYLTNTPLSKTTTEEEIRNQVEVEGEIVM
jgi:hypothetical protein